MTFADTDDTSLLVEAACDRLGVPFALVDSDTFDFTQPPLLEDGDALLRLGAGPRDSQVERWLFRPGLRTLYRSPLGPFQATNDAAFHLRRQGLPFPQPWPVTLPSTELLLNAVQRLGGFPVLVGTQGMPVGTAVLVARNIADLVGLVRHFMSEGRACTLFAKPPPGVFWRVTVLDEDVLAAATGPWDGHPATQPFFDDPASYASPLPSDLHTLARSAVAAMGFRAGTVDLHVTPEQGPRLLDAVFPPELLIAQEVTGRDVAAKVVTALARDPAA